MLAFFYSKVKLLFEYNLSMEILSFTGTRSSMRKFLNSWNCQMRFCTRYSFSSQLAENRLKKAYDTTGSSLIFRRKSFALILIIVPLWLEQTNLNSRQDFLTRDSSPIISPTVKTLIYKENTKNTQTFFQNRKQNYFITLICLRTLTLEFLLRAEKLRMFCFMISSF